MNREIKFRGRSEYGAFVYGDLIQYENGDVAIFEKKLIKYGCEATEICKRTKVNAKTVGQFTGLCDKNNKEIYEGDILMCIGQREDNKGRKYFRKVLFKNGSFCMSVPEYNVASSLYGHVVNGKLNWEVIGNIYDNKELLEETK